MVDLRKSLALVLISNTKSTKLNRELADEYKQRAYSFTRNILSKRRQKKKDLGITTYCVSQLLSSVFSKDSRMLLSSLDYVRENMAKD
jgi:hypothetical protein